MDKKKIVLSGIQPTGTPTLGNYVGAVRNWSLLQTDETFCCYCIADLHAITVRQNATELRKNRYNMAALLLAAGIDPERSIIFMQSHVPEHTQLSWVLNCHTYMGELSRMTQFKDKSAKHEDNINAGLFTYPVLMAADILLYQSDLVPVGHDQKQHLELARDIAIRFNNAFGEVFTVPQGYIPKTGGRIMSLQEPDKKMSKSDANKNAFVAIMDDPAVIRNKFKRAITDCDGEIRFDPENKPGVSNLLSIYMIFTGKTAKEAEKDFAGMGYGVLKERVAEVVIEEITPIQERFNEFAANKQLIEKVLAEGAEKARLIARKTVSKVYHKVGFDK